MPQEKFYKTDLAPVLTTILTIGLVLLAVKAVFDLATQGEQFGYNAFGSGSVVTPWPIWSWPMIIAFLCSIFWFRRRRTWQYGWAGLAASVLSFVIFLGVSLYAESVVSSNPAAQPLDHMTVPQQ